MRQEREGCGLNRSASCAVCVMEICSCRGPCLRLEVAQDRWRASSLRIREPLLAGELEGTSWKRAFVQEMRIGRTGSIRV